jgi:uncharacterized protein YbcI
MPGQEAEDAAIGPRGAAISNFVVRVVSEYTGRGPTRARTYISDNLVCVVLEDTLTKGERSLLRDGLGDQVLDMRKSFQKTMRGELVRGIEEITGRRVVAFFSDNHMDPDTAMEAFLLAPDGD